MKKYILFAAVYLLGVASFPVAQQLVSRAYAEVAGMGNYELQSDYDFQRAVRSIVENDCSVDGSDIDC